MRCRPRRARVALAIVAFVAGPLRAQESNPPELGTFRSDSAVLRYALDRPAGPGPFPIIILVHGSGRATRDEMLNIVPKFTERGFAVFRYDKRGVGESGGVYRGVNATTSSSVIPELARDAAAAFATACSTPGIDSKRCGFFGASQAGWIIPEAMRIAEGSAFAILFSGATIPVGNQMYFARFTGQANIALDSAYAALARFDAAPGYDPRGTLAAIAAPTLWLLGLQDQLLPNRWAIQQLDSLRVSGRPVRAKAYADYGHALGPEIWSEIDLFLAGFRTLATVPSTTGHWTGEARLASQVWRVEVTTRADSIWLSVPSLWSPRQPVKNLSRNGRVLRFDFPMDIGTIELNLDSEAAQVAGTLRSPAGAVGSVRLTKKESSPFSVREIAVVRAGIVIAGSASTPAKPGRKPAVVILHGGGPSSRADSPPYRFWGEYFAAKGYVAITYDKRGNGESTGDWRTVGFGERADDVLALVQWLRRQPDVDPDRIGLFAVSQGTWVASLVAARDPKTIGFVVQVSGPLVSPFEADTYAALNSLRAAGLDARQRGEFEQLWRQEVGAIRHPADSAAWDRYRAADLAARATTWYTKARYAPSVPESWFTNWYRLVADFDPVPALRNVRAPVLWLYGDHDTQSDVPLNLTLIDRIRKAAPVRFEVAHFADTGHGFLAPVDSSGAPLGPLATPPGFFEALETWLVRHAQPGSS